MICEENDVNYLYYGPTPAILCNMEYRIPELVAALNKLEDAVMRLAHREHIATMTAFIKGFAFAVQGMVVKPITKRDD